MAEFLFLSARVLYVRLEAAPTRPGAQGPYDENIFLTSRERRRAGIPLTRGLI